MPGISKYTGDNYGGIARLYYALMRDITALFDFEYEADNLTISQANFDAYFSELKFQKREANYDYDRKPTDGATEYNHVVDVAFPANRSEVRSHMDITDQSKVCLVLKTNNGDWLIVPNMEERTDVRSGDDVDKRNASNFQWSAKLPHKELPLTIN